MFSKIGIEIIPQTEFDIPDAAKNIAEEIIGIGLSHDNE
jgi:hypothetical protein